jgi:hypothetical protein
MALKYRAAILCATIAALAAALSYLRDPPWLATMTSGIRGRSEVANGVRYRWTSGHASFFVPSSAPAIAIPLRSPATARDPFPVVATISIDDRPATRVTLGGEEWTRVWLRLPPPGSRRLRRIDIRVFPTREDYRGVQVADVEVSR